MFGKRKTPDRISLSPSDDPELPPKQAGPKFYTAMGTYTVFALLAVFTLDGKLRLAVLILLAGLAVKTYLATLRKP